MVASTIDDKPPTDTADGGHEVARGPAEQRAEWRWRLQLSSVTLKLVMAFTGVVFALFVLAHMIGNLKVYAGAAGFDHYAHWLRTLGEPLLPFEGALWLFRVVLGLCLLAHVGAAVMLTVRGHRARGRFRRAGMRSLRTFTARTMFVGGVVLLLFIIFHILDLTTGTRPAASETYSAGRAYDNLIASFERPAVALFYFLAMAVLGAHLVHGLWTVVNDFGVTGHRARQVLVAGGGLLALSVTVGNMSIPVAVQLGFL
ncbi:succinate dehydrogenase cytochrome b subunit [Mycobacterium sp. ITM-2016-00317]|uniref:succinate dehydrogenase cytochrome b subunit n=1 Tax=Mycobacterium sp. ITM-2016-00317 TaxID=2099694 RepID=UPI00287FBE36|nr:succinate dehydrogenase cytochrome b subunit [Mycobacterium sp. ITM-2016-00317]WNG90311.1 succinate dehydrogenase cytochrome b subunit [Mycobacterium sp. ITM-2016-00317]